MSKKNLLFEIGLEDLPSKNLDIFSEKIKNNIEKNFNKNNIDFSSIDNYFTNIRLIFLINDINEIITTEKKTIKGPPFDKCYDENNNPSKTGLGFAKKYNVKLEDLSKVKVDGKEYLFYEQPKIITNLVDVLPKILEDSLKNIEEQKKMRWGKTNTSFIRPIRWLLLMLDNKHVEGKIFDINITKHTFGDKSLSNKKINLGKINNYFDLLNNEKIEINQNLRKKIIQDEIKLICSEKNFDEKIDSEILNEVSNMAEYPYLYLGSFPEKYLELPEEVLKYVIQDTQKYFLVYKNGKISNYFFGVSNVKINKKIVEGNERVINPRLDDAKFFISKDLSSNIFSKKEFLKRVIFHKKLGSVFDKVERISNMSSHIIKKSFSVENLKCEEIANVCKLDLMSSMVVEIPKLQGVMGSYYATKLGLDEKIANGIKEHYAPKNPEDRIPSSMDAQIVSTVDKLDTVVGIFLVNEKPTGTRDPLGIRRSTNGLLKILLQVNLKINLNELVDLSANLIYKNFGKLKKNNEALAECNSFLKEKLILILKENYEFDENIIFSVISPSNEINPFESLKKIKIIKSILGNTDYDDLFANAKRVSNILKKSNENVSSKINKNLLRESSEKILYNAINEIEADLQLSLKENNYAEYLEKLNNLNTDIKTFFEEVMINANEEDIRINRLALLTTINNYYKGVADITILSH
jgi:glycyl-tRNA synthetase beta chain